MSRVWRVLLVVIGGVLCSAKPSDAQASMPQFRGDVTLETPNLQHNTSWSLSDVYLQPVRLGWSKPSADFVAGLGVYMRSGRLLNGADVSDQDELRHRDAALLLRSGQSRRDAGQVALPDVQRIHASQASPGRSSWRDGSRSDSDGPVHFASSGVTAAP